MGLIVGLDIGGTTTKIVGYDKRELIGFVRVQASDPFTSASGGLGKFLNVIGKNLSDVDQIHATGVGASQLDGDLFNCRTLVVPEFDCVGLGGLYLADLDEAIVVSMGTGTSIVAARGKKVKHIIGSGVGGGTLQGLAEKMLNIEEFETISGLANQGDLGMVDLTIGDITTAEIPGLTADATASNFGKLQDLARAEDIAAGIVNLVFQSVGTASVLAARLKRLDRIVITGNLSLMPLGKKVLDGFSNLYNLTFLIPEHAEFATAVGASIIGNQTL
ncbi:MAG: type II pantothenate kinase [Anaerolineaceae bacterium]